VQLYKYQAGVQNGAALISAQDTAHTAAALEIAQRSGNNVALAYALLNRSMALLHNDSVTAGLQCLAEARQMFEDQRLTMSLRRMLNVEVARERARSGDLDGAISLATSVLDKQFDCGEMIFRGPTTTVLTEALLSRGSAGDIEEAERTVDRLAAVPTEPGFVLFELPVLRLRALLARARGDEAGYRRFLQRFGALAQQAGYEGCVAAARAMA
jgi:adenylate cyclase